MADASLIRQRRSLHSRHLCSDTKLTARTTRVSANGRSVWVVGEWTAGGGRRGGMVASKSRLELA
jgi:hypothetical protein